MLVSATTTPIKGAASPPRTAAHAHGNSAREKKRAADQKFKEWKAKKDLDAVAEHTKRAAKERRFRQEVASVQSSRKDAAYEAWLERKQRGRGGADAANSRKIAVKTLTLTLVNG